MPLSICMCRYVGGFFGAPIFSFLYTLLDTVPLPIYAHLPSVLVSLPCFSTGYGPRRCLIPLTSTFWALTQPPFLFLAFFSNRRTSYAHSFYHLMSPHHSSCGCSTPRNFFFQAQKILKNHTHILWLPHVILLLILQPVCPLIATCCSSHGPSSLQFFFCHFHRFHTLFLLGIP